MGEFGEHDRRFMIAAMESARTAELAGEVPVGAVVVKDGEVLVAAANCNIGNQDPCAHAEIIALREAGRKLGNHRLTGCSMYVTLEPCCMCAGAMIHARLDACIFGAPDPKTGAAGGRFDLLGDDHHNHHPEIRGGLMAEECGEMLRSFFKARRK